ncbi:MAG TPA: hypothetical protein ENK43_11285 [Planctomycetes bacterium]|nr:hypothetical protein [Planctomycetota bacterium]
MKSIPLILAFLVLPLTGQMEKRLRVLYDRKAFRLRSPVLGAQIPDLVLRDLDGKKVSLRKLVKSRRVVLIGGAYT